MAFDDYIAQRRAELDTIELEPDIDASVQVAVEQDPDRAAAQHEITSKSGVVNPDVDEWKKQERLNKIRDGDYGPNLRTLLANTQTAAIVQDDVDNLAATERALDPGSIQGQLASSGKILKDIGKAAYSGVLRASTGLQGVLEAGIDTVEDVTGLDVPGSDYLKAQRKFGQQRAKELMPNTDNAVANAVYSGISSSVQNLITIAGTQGRSTLAAMSSMVAGESYTEGKDQGLTTTGAQLFALTDGIVEALTEKLPLDELFKALKGGGGFWKTLGKQLALEVPTEQVATVLQDFNAWAVLPENADKPFQSYLDDRPRAAFDTLIATMTGTTLTTSVTMAPSVVKNAFDNRKAKRDLAAFDAAVAEYERTTASVADQERLDTLTTLAQESKTSKRAAQVYKDFLAGAGSDQSVYVPADVVEALEGEIPEALATDGLGGDVEIPMDVFMTEIATNESLMAALRPHMKMGLDRLSASEIENGTGDTVRRILERAKVSAETKTETDRIWETVREQIEATGVMSAKNAKLSAQIIPAMIAATAQRRGLTPTQVFEAMNFTVQKPGQTAPTGSVMEQAEKQVYDLEQNLLNKYDIESLHMMPSGNGDSILIANMEVNEDFRGGGIGTDVMSEIVRFADQNDKRLELEPATPEDGMGTTSRERLVEFYKRFGFIETPEGMVRQPKKRLERARAMGFDTDTVWYHGTNKEFLSFNPSARGASTGAKSALEAEFLTDSSGVASAYAELSARNDRSNSSGQNIIPVMMRAQNPLVIDELDYPDGFSLPEKIAEAKSRGHDALVIKNSSDSPVRPVITAGGEKLYGVDIGGMFAEETLPSLKSGDIDVDTAIDEVDEYIEYLQGEISTSEQEWVPDLQSELEDWQKLSAALKDDPSSVDTFITRSTVAAIFDPANIRSVNAAFAEEGSNILAQEDVRQSKRQEIMRKLLECVRAAA